MDRVHLVNPGERSQGRPPHADRAFKPPVYDNSVTTGFYDDDVRRACSAPTASARSSRTCRRTPPTFPTAELRAGQTTWVTIDSPWIHKVDRATFAAELACIRALEPSTLLSGHLPPAPGAMLDRLLDTLATAPDAAPFAGPDQVALEQMLDAAMAPQMAGLSSPFNQTVDGRMTHGLRSFQPLS